MSDMIILGFPPSELNPNARLHWAKKSRIAKKYRNECRIKTIVCLNAFYRAILQAHTGRFQFNVIFYKKNNRKQDDDNIFSAFKSGRDGIADALNIDDNRFKSAYTVSDEIITNGMVVVEIKLIQEDSN